MSDLFSPEGDRDTLTQEHRFEGKLKQWRSMRMDLTAKVVCKKCNETWMSDIEARTSTSFSQIMRLGSSVSILQRGVSLLAAFAFEKAVIADHQHLKGDPFFKFADRNRFRESRAIPAGVQIWLAALQPRRGVYRLFFKRHRGFDVRSRVDLEYLTFTYAAGHLIIQLTASRWADKLNARPLPRVESDTSFDSAAVEIWPQDGFAVSWPPSHYFTDETIATFAERFDYDVPLVRHPKR